MTHANIRLATQEDLASLAVIERSAAKAFSSYPDYSPDWGTVPKNILEKMSEEEKLWVAVNKEKSPIGFIGCQDIDHSLYLYEISVCQEYQQKGIGKALIESVISFATKQGYKTISLTTSKDIPWNMPFYKKMGFQIIEDFEKNPALLKKLKEEQKELELKTERCAMVRNCKG